MNKEKEVIAKVVSVETGEVLDELFCGDRILKYEKQKKKNEYLQTHVMNFNKGVSFVKTFAETAYILSLVLSPKECQVILGLTKFISYEDCALKTGINSQSHYMDLHEIADVLHMDYSRTSRIVSSLIKKRRTWTFGSWKHFK